MYKDVENGRAVKGYDPTRLQFELGSWMDRDLHGTYESEVLSFSQR